jgi:hypothetical protein
LTAKELLLRDLPASADNSNSREGGGSAQDAGDARTPASAARAPTTGGDDDLFAAHTITDEKPPPEWQQMDAAQRAAVDSQWQLRALAKDTATAAQADLLLRVENTLRTIADVRYTFIVP